MDREIESLQRMHTRGGNFLINSWLRGVVVIKTATGTEGRGFESRQGVRLFKEFAIEMLLFVN
jgi:hypothetical protein